MTTAPDSEDISGQKRVPKVFAVTLNWKQRFDTAECIRALQQLDYPNYEIVAIDNGSGDGSVEYLREQFRDTIYIVANRENLGYSDGFNSGIDYAMKHGAQYILILNNDTKIDPAALSELVKTAESDPKIAFVSGKVYFYETPNILQTVGKKSHPITIVGAHVGANEEDRGQYEKEEDYEFIDDVYLLVRASVVKELGSYDPLFFLYFEETDWCARVRRAGYRIVYTPGAKIWHKGSLSSGGGQNPVNTFWTARNRYPFMRRNGSPKQWRLFLLHNFFKVIPMTALARVKKGQFGLLKSLLKGNLEGLIWTLRNLHVRKEAS